MNKFFLTILFFSVLLLADTAFQGKAYEYFLQGEYALLQKNYKQAESDFSNALFLAPNSPTILRSLVDLKSTQGAYADAIEYLEKIIELEPLDKESGIQLFQLYIQEGTLDAASVLLDTLLEYHPDEIEFLYAKANIQYANKDWTNLIKTYHSIYLSDVDNMDIILKIYEIGLATDHVSILLDILQQICNDYETPLAIELLVELLSGKKDYSAAIYYINKLIEIDGNTDQLTLKLGELYLLSRQYEYVIITLEPLYQTGNHTLELMRLLLIAYSTIENSEAQIDISFVLIDEYPKLSIGYEALAFSYLDVGDEANALKILHQALNKFPDEITFPHTIAKIYFQSKNYSHAEEYFLAALEINAQISSIQHSLAIMFEEMLDTDRSDSLFKKMIIQNENDAVGLNDYAYIIAERTNSSMNELNYAKELAERALAIEPDNAAFLDTIGWIYYKMGLYDQAQLYLGKSLKINQDNPVILEHMGDIYHMLDESAQALILYEKAHIKDLGNTKIQDKINEINGR